MRRVLMIAAVALVLSPLVFTPTPEAQGQILGVGTATLSWVPPTQRTDGSPLVLNQIRIYREVNNEQIWNLLDSVPGSVTTYIDDNLFNGTYCYAVTATDFQNLESVRSNSMCKTVETGGNVPRPLPPTGLTVL